MNEEKCIKLNQLDPTLLYVCKGTRRKEIEVAHSHEYIEIAFVLSGKGKYNIDHVVYEVEEGDVLILNPGVLHQAIPTEDGERGMTEYFVGCTNVQIECMEYNHFPKLNPGNILKTQGEVKQRLFRIFTSMDTESVGNKEGMEFMLKAYMVQLILVIARSFNAKQNKDEEKMMETINVKDVTEQIVNYLEDHYKEKISLEQLAENVYVSPFYISKIFKSETGDAPIRRLISIRLEKAKELLINNSKLSIQEVAEEVGYNDVYHFSKLFKKKYGIAPSQMRKVRDIT